MNKKTILMILDGWGIPEDKNASAIHHAHTPFIDSLFDNYPNATLLTHGLHVGLPEGQMGNSEVGHMNLGAGRIVYQDLAKINLAIKNNTLKDEASLVATLDYAKINNKAIHFLGLVSDGGVHSHIDHIKALTSISHNYGIENSYIHAFTDGRDVDPKSGLEHIKHLQKHIAKTNTKLATVTGRYYAMDRDQRWERIQKAYDALVYGKGVLSDDAIKTIAAFYEEDITDEFIPPIILSENNKPVTTIQEGDAIIFFNFRTDRGRQLTSALSQEDFPKFGMKKLNTYFTTLTNYDDTFKDLQIIFDKENITDTLGEVLANNHKRQIRIAETEKYPHVTFFFNGGREALFKGEDRILCESPKVATYDLKPAMSSDCIAESIVTEIKKETVDFICLNFASPDMVGHTGSMKAAIAACESVNNCAEKVITEALAHDYTTIVIADHGNCEKMMNEDGSPNTAHTTNPVPIIVVDPDIKTVSDGILGDIAPTVLALIGITKPIAMTGKSLI